MRLATWTLTTVWVALLCITSTTSQGTNGCSGAYTAYFVVDGSESISNSSFEEVRNALIAFVNESIRSNSLIQAGVVLYSDDVTAVITASSDINSLVNAIRMLAHPSAGTSTHLGIRRAKALLDVDTSGNPHIMIVMTDGLSNYPADTKAAAAETKNSGIRVFAVGVNPLLNFPSSPYKIRYEQELVDIASDNSAIQIENFSNLLNTVQGIVQSLCRDIAAITNNMRDVTVLSGTSPQLATFVNATGVTNGVWRREGVDLTGDNRYTKNTIGALQSLTIPNVQTSQAGLYSYSVDGATTQATLTVIERMTNYTRNVGESQSFLVNVSPGGTAGAWFRNGVPLSNGAKYTITQTTGTLRRITVQNIQTSDSGEYVYVVNGVESKGYLTVTDPDLTNQTVETGYAATFQVTLSETNVRSGSWFKDGTRLFNSVKTQISNRDRVQTLVVVNAQPVDSGVYRFSAGDVSTSASLSVLPANCAADVVIVLDGSNFIFTKTELPKIKELLKQQINATLQNFRNVRFGVVVYGRNVSGTIDLSSDPLSIKTQIDSLSVIGGGAYINLGIREARRLLVADQLSKSKHMIVIVGSLSSSPSDTIIAGKAIRSAGIQVKAVGVLGFFKTVPILYTQFKTNLNAITSGVGSVTEFDNITSFVNAFDVKSGICSSVVDGGLSSWSSWELDNCRVTCGVNFQTTGRRSRSCIAPTPQNGGLPCTGPLQEAVGRMCDVPRCPVNGAFSPWTSWENATLCSPTCGTVGTRRLRRRRFCNAPPPLYGGRNCTGAYDDVIVVSCIVNRCPRDGGLTPWTEWSGPACLQTCGPTFTKTVTRSKSCTNPTPINGGRDCSLLGSTSEAETRSCNLPNCPINGGITLWTQWSNPPCPLTCGSFATKAVDRRRTCANPTPAFGGADCPEQNRFESKTTSCFLPDCGDDGSIYSEWGQWDNPTCAVSCGQAATKTVTRVRTCMNPQSGGANCQGATRQTNIINCGLSPCPINGTFTQWGQWDNPACGATCGQTATRTVRRTRICLPPQFGGWNCLGPLSETQEVSCGLGLCPLDGGYSLWTEWSGVACTGTCGTSYTRTVTRVRTCNNPVPANNGRDCSQLGPSTESVGRLCTLTPCPNASQHLCDNVQRQNDVGYRYHPSDCDKYVQCFFNPSGNVIGVYRSCPFGFYWNQVTFQCDESWKVSCPLERCTGSCAASYKLEGSCRSYWLCDGMKSVAKCCPQGFSFFPGHGCRANYYCDDLCPNTYSCREVCQKRPDWTGTAGIYNTFVEGIGWKSGSCRSGTVFDIAECGCIDQRGCAITHDLDSRTPLPWLRATNVSINSGIATLVSTSRMYLDIKMTIDTPVSVKFRFREAQAVSGRRILMSSSDCKKGNSLLITVEDQGIQFSVWSWYGDVTKMTIFTQGMSRSDWKTVNVGYNGRELSGVVESGRLTYMSKVMASSANIMECGLQVGGDNSSNTSAAFVGSIDTLQVSRCNPGLTP